MATYKKRGQKLRTKEVEQEIIEDGESTTQEVFSTLDEGANRTEEWLEKNQKPIFAVIALIALGILAYIGYQKFIQAPKELEASNEMYQAQNYFNEAVAGATAKDSLFNLALTGGEGKYGFLDIIDNYGSTKAGNLARYYTGVAYLNTKKYQEAIDYLEDFKSEDEMLAPLSKGAIGDAFMQLDQPEQALSFYEKAAQLRDNSFTAPQFLFKAGTTALQLGQKEKAAGFFTKIKEKYPDSDVAKDIEVYLGMTKTNS